MRRTRLSLILLVLTMGPGADGALVPGPKETLAERVTELRLLARSDPERVIDEAPTLLSELAGSTDPALAVDLRYALGFAFLRVEQYDAAATHLESARGAAENLDSCPTLAPILVALGNIDMRRGRFAEAADAWTAAGTAAERSGDHVTLSRSILNLAAIDQRRGDFQGAIARVGQALRIAQELSDTETLIRIHNNLGTLHNELGQHEDALESLQESRRLHRSLHDGADDHRILSNMAVAVGGLGRREEAHALLRAAIGLLREAGRERELASTTLNLAIALLTQEETRPDGLRMATDALEIFERLGLPLETAHTLSNLAQARFDMGEPDRAMDDLERSLGLARAIGANVILVKLLELRSTIHESRQELDAALSDLREATTLGRDLRSPDHGRALADLGASDRRSRNEARIANLEAAQRAQKARQSRRTVAIRVLGGLGLLVIGALAWRATTRRRQLLRLEHAYDQILAVARGLSPSDRDFEHALRAAEKAPGVVPICSWCRSIRDREGAWFPLEEYLSERSELRVTHGICPHCADEMESEG